MELLNQTAHLRLWPEMPRPMHSSAERFLGTLRSIYPLTSKILYDNSLFLPRSAETLSLLWLLRFSQIVPNSYDIGRISTCNWKIWRMSRIKYLFSWNDCYVLWHSCYSFVAWRPDLLCCYTNDFTFSIIIYNSCQLFDFLVWIKSFLSGDEVQIGLLMRHLDLKCTIGIRSLITGISGNSPFTVHQQIGIMRRYLSLGQKKPTPTRVIQPVQWGV